MSKKTEQPELFPTGKQQITSTFIVDLPHGWKFAILDGLVTQMRLGGNYENAESHFGIPVIKMGNIGRGNIVLDKIQYLPSDVTPNEQDVLSPGDLLLNTRNTLDLVGKVAIWQAELPYAVYNSNLMRFDFDGREVASTAFMNYVFNSEYGIRQLRAFAIGTTSVAAIYNRDLLHFKVLLPPLPEQRKIAAILNTWDTAIDTTEKLIVAKEQLKQGLMQRLLTGKLRFREFKKGTWKETKLGEVFIERKEIGYSHLELLAITGSGGVVKRDTLEKRDSSAEDKGKYLRILPGDIGYNTMRMWQGVSGVSSYEGIISPAYTVVIPTDEIDAQFMGYLFKFPPMVYLFWRYSQGLVDDTLNCKYESFSRIHIHIPKKVEQQKIATLLSACDHEIQLLKTQLVALKRQKKGLMQQLLTGRVRVKVEEDKSVVAM